MYYEWLRTKHPFPKVCKWVRLTHREINDELEVCRPDAYDEFCDFKRNMLSFLKLCKSNQTLSNLI